MLTRESCIADTIRYKRLKQEIKTMNDECEVLRERIMRYMDELGTDRISSESITAIRYKQFQKRLDTKRLEIDHPDLVTDYRFEKQITGLKVL